MRRGTVGFGAPPHRDERTDPQRARQRTRAHQMTEAYALTDGFGLDRLMLVDWPVEELPPGHVRIAVEAVSLNRRDLLLVVHDYRTAQSRRVKEGARSGTRSPA